MICLWCVLYWVYLILNMQAVVSVHLTGFVYNKIKRYRRRRIFYKNFYLFFKNSITNRIVENDAKMVCKWINVMRSLHYDNDVEATRRTSSRTSELEYVADEKKENIYNWYRYFKIDYESAVEQEYHDQWYERTDNDKVVDLYITGQNLACTTQLGVYLRWWTTNITEEKRCFPLNKMWILFFLCRKLQRTVCKLYVAKLVL